MRTRIATHPVEPRTWRRRALLLTVTAFAAGAVPSALAGSGQPVAAPSSAGRFANVFSSSVSDPSSRNVTISVLSGRADLVSGGDALVRVTAPNGASPSKLKITVGGRDANRLFAKRPDGQYEGLVTGLRLGRNLVRAELPDGRGATLMITNHPNGGPVFSGPQLRPWTCQATAVDKQCDQPATYSFLYQPIGRTDLEPYDAQNPPSDVATTTTDQGKQVPFIVRQEIGYQARSQYTILMLFVPGAKWEPWSPQPQWNHKMLITHGGGCGGSYGATAAPLNDGFPPAVPVPQSYVFALGRGFGVASTALDNAGVDCNVVTMAESLIMVKERIVERYGLIRYTIGTGCSGGSFAQQQTANAYPGGIYNGVIVACSFPDAFSGSATVLATDWHLLNMYFTTPSKFATQAWTQRQIAAVYGEPTQPQDAFHTDALFSPQFGAVPVQLGSGLISPIAKCGFISDAQRYNADTNPGGIRCSAADWGVNVFGRRAKSVWTPQEKKIKRGFAGVPLGFAGVQYGLNAFEEGIITWDQFFSLNAGIGSMDIDYEPMPGRKHADQPALANAYRSGAINDASHYDQVAIINGLGPNEPVMIHPAINAYALRARLDRAHGSHRNQVLWGGPVNFIGSARFWFDSLIAMDRWLTAVESDTSSRPLAEKIRNRRPADINDSCFDAIGTKLSDGPCPFVPVFRTPRMVAGDHLTIDNNECRLKPVRPADYRVALTDAQLAALRHVFPEGVCDYSKPGVSQQPTIPWQTYQRDGRPIIGGTAMGPAPRSIPYGDA
jgi:hypothetical protein